MESFNAKDLSTIGGIATVSLLHSFIPTHWLPFSIVGRAQKWTLSRTLIVTAFGAVLHVISTSLLGITAITMANSIAGEETVHRLASLLLLFLGGSYILLFVFGKGGHGHSHNHPMEKMAVAGLVLVPALSPCATTLPVFLAVGNSSSMMVLAIIVLLFRFKCFAQNFAKAISTIGPISTIGEVQSRGVSYSCRSTWRMIKTSASVYFDLWTENTYVKDMYLSRLCRKLEIASSNFIFEEYIFFGWSHL